MIWVVCTKIIEGQNFIGDILIPPPIAIVDVLTMLFPTVLHGTKRIVSLLDILILFKGASHYAHRS